MTVYINQIARNWYSKHLTGATPQISLNQLKRRYYLEYLGTNVASNTKPSLLQLEKMWLAKYVSDNAGPVADFNYESIEWIDAVLAIGKVPTKFEQQNKIIFYLNAA